MVLRLPEELHSSLRDREYPILRQLSNPDTAMYSGFFNGCIIFTINAKYYTTKKNNLEGLFLATEMNSIITILTPVYQCMLWFFYMQKPVYSYY